MLGIYRHYHVSWYHYYCQSLGRNILNILSLRLNVPHFIPLLYPIRYSLFVTFQLQIRLLTNTSIQVGQPLIENPNMPFGCFTVNTNVFI